MSQLEFCRGEFVLADDYAGRRVGDIQSSPLSAPVFLEKSFNADASNWWFATKSCLKAMTRVAGFPTIEEIDQPEYLVAANSR